MSTNRLLVSAVIVLLVVVGGLGGYYLYTAGFFSNLKLPTTGSKQETGQLGTQKVPFLSIGEFTYFPDGWDGERCGTQIMFLNPHGDGVTCEKFFKEAPVAINVEIKTSATLGAEKAKGAKALGGISQVSGKEAVQLQSGNKTLTVITLTDKYYLYITLNDNSKYKAEYDQIVKATNILSVDILSAPKPVIVQPTGIVAPTQ